MSIASIQSKYPSAIWYDSNHSGGTNSGTLDNPYTSLDTAMTNASSGGVIAILDGTHTEDTTIAIPKDLVLVGESLLAVLNTTGSAMYGGGLQGGGFDVTLETLTLEHTVGPLTVINPGAGGNLTIDSCKVKYGPSVLNYTNQWGLIGGAQGVNLTIQNSTLEIGARNYAILMGGHSNTGNNFSNITITGNTFIIITGSTVTNISKQTGFTSSVWKNNIFVGQVGTEVLNFTPGTYSNNCFDNTGLTSGGTDNLFATDPIFVDSASGDYRLRPDSPCLGAGTAS